MLPRHYSLSLLPHPPSPQVCSSIICAGTRVVKSRTGGNGTRRMNCAGRICLDKEETVLEASHTTHSSSSTIIWWFMVSSNIISARYVFFQSRLLTTFLLSAFVKLCHIYEERYTDSEKCFRLTTLPVAKTVQHPTHDSGKLCKRGRTYSLRHKLCPL